MGFKVEQLAMDKAKSMVQDFSFALINSISNILFDKVEAVSSIDWNELIEARFFSKSSELHIYRYNNELSAVLISDDADDDFIVRKYVINDKQKLFVKQYLDYDEDGQAIIKMTRLLSIE